MLLRDAVTLNCRSVDRIFLQRYVPQLRTVGQVCTFLRWVRGYEIPSSAAFGKIGEQYVRDVEAEALTFGLALPPANDASLATACGYCAASPHDEPPSTSGPGGGT
jgi:hypothetical protein